MSCSKPLPAIPSAAGSASGYSTVGVGAASTSQLTLLEEINRDCVVHVGDLKIPEYTFKIKYDFSKRKPKLQSWDQQAEYNEELDVYQKQIDKLCIVVTALLNTSGGVIIVHSAYRTDPKTIDSWLNNIHQQLKCIPKWIYDESVKTSIRGDTVHFFIRKAPGGTQITFKSHLYVRNPGATSEMCNDNDHLRTIISRSLASKPQSYFRHLCLFEDVEVGPETQHVEYKDWYETTAEGILGRLKENPKALIGMANVDGGGGLVIGVYEDKPSGRNKVRGVDLNFLERELLLLELNSWLSTMITGYQTKLQEEVDWSLKFVDVRDAPQSRCLVIIHLNYIPGGLFHRKPQCFIVTGKAMIEEIPFKDWICALSKFTIGQAKALAGTDKSHGRSNMPTLVSDSTYLTPLDIHKQDSAASNPTCSVDEQAKSRKRYAHSAESSILPLKPDIAHTSSDSDMSDRSEPEDQQTVRDETGAHIRDKGNKRISTSLLKQQFSNISLNEDISWRELLKYGSDGQDEVKLRLNITEKSPLLFTPSVDKVIHMCMDNCSHGAFTENDIRYALNQIQDRHINQKGFALSFCSWDQAFDNDDPRPVPTWHALDVLVKIEDTIELIAVFGDGDDLQTAAHKQYIYLLSRKIKRHLQLEDPLLESGCSANFIFQPVICYPKQQKMVSCLDRSDILAKDILDIWGRDQLVAPQIFTDALKNLLIKKSTHIKDRVNRDKNLQLTGKQVECTVRCIDSRFTLIDAAPGAGKSVIISYLADRWNGGNRRKVLCICPKNPFAIHLAKQQKCDVIQADDTIKMNEAIDRIAKGKYIAVLIDDGQMIACGKETWTKLLETILESAWRKNGTKLCIVLDSKFQAFEGPHNAIVIKESFRTFCTTYDISPTELSLRKVLRNEQKVFSFMMSNILQEHSVDGKDLLCYQTEEGDDVKLHELARMWENSSQNGLLEPGALLDKSLPEPLTLMVLELGSSMLSSEVFGVCGLMNGDIVLCDHGRDKLSVYSSQGHYITSHSITGVQDVSGTPDGGMVAVNLRTLFRLDRQGHKLWRLSAAQLRPQHVYQWIDEDMHSVCVDQDGMIYTRLDTFVCIIKPDGTIFRYLEDNVPVITEILYCGIAVQPSGSLLLPDPGNNCVVKFSQTGRHQMVLRGVHNQYLGLFTPCGVAVDTGGNVYVTSHNNHTVSEYSPDGKFMKSWGGPDQFFNPTGISITPNGNVIVCDHHRVQIY